MSSAPGVKDSLAAQYALDIADPDATLEMVEEALRWIDQSPENRHAFERVRHFLDACDALPEAPSPLSVSESEEASWHKRLWHAPLLAASMAALAVATTLLMLLALWNGPAGKQAMPEGAPAFQDHYASRVGETRKVVLPDGSSVTLAGASSISVRYRAGQRRLVLDRGEALFTVARDPKRPFSVKSGNSMVVALGTEFNVKRNPDTATVTLVHGVVDVGSLARSRTRHVRLKPGMQVRLADNGQMGEPRMVEVSRILDWRNGLLRFEDAPLGDVVADLNRYSKRPIVIDRRIGALPISGSVKTDAIDEWLRGLESAFDIDVDKSAPENIRLRERGAAPNRA